MQTTQYDERLQQMPESGMTGAAQKPKRRFRPVYLLAALPILAVLALVLFWVFFSVHFIPSAAMSPTLEEGDRVAVRNGNSAPSDIEREMIVVFSQSERDPSGPDLIKRVIGLPGETITLESGEVWINGVGLAEPYLEEAASTRPLRDSAIPGCDNESPTECAVPEGHVFVMGDNRGGSRDSREFGPIPVDSIVGQASVRFRSFSDYASL